MAATAPPPLIYQILSSQLCSCLSMPDTFPRALNPPQKQVRYDCNCEGVTSRSEHYLAVHQLRTKVTFPDKPTLEIHIQRDHQTKQFHCPRCNISYIVAANLRTHTLRGHCPGRLPPPRSQLQPEPSAPVKTEQLLPRRRRRHGLNRTQRALARSRYAKSSVKDIAEFLGCQTREVHKAHENACGDILSEDPLYLNGRKGDIINVDSDDDMEVEEPVAPMQGDDNQGGLEVGCQPPSIRTEFVQRALHRSKPKLQVEDCDPEVSVSNARHGQAVEYVGARQYTKNKTVPAAVRQMPPPPVEVVPSTSQVHAQRVRSARKEAAQCFVGEFLRKLDKRCDQHLELFYASGITTEEDLRGLARTGDKYLEEIRKEFMRQGMSLYEWVKVKEGLDRLASGRIDTV
ncbi:hypothetical protein BXZ70DRAFT_301602 [Cristinia sonorae]|uniref:C2H2-type domain-containing protein n=1 Tax=Cristinia sonorae TaxID=1940300 RepID=A0A8K0XNR0_9AGAR|nr:hypothetical protein BXZ70DRAFT_301602 [Cristinia sonorae]